MRTSIRTWLIHSFCWFLIAITPTALWAKEKTEEVKNPDWVIPYFTVMGLLALGAALLMRSAKRSETSFTLEEQDAERQKQTKQH